MSCIFCDSFYHLSEFCNIYVSNDVREEIIHSKNLCQNCLNVNCGYSVVEEDNSTTFPINKECNSTKKCYICYTKSLHCTVFCPARFKAPKLFIPRINQNLYPRFLEIFNFDEKLLLTFQSPIIFNKSMIQPMIVTEKYPTSRFSKHIKHVTFMCKKCDLRNYNNNSKMELLNNISSKIWTIVAESIDISFEKLNAVDVTLLLSQRTKILKLQNVMVFSTFDEIFKMSPKLEEFEFDAARENIVHSFLKFKYENGYSSFTITVHPYFKIQSLLAVMCKIKQNAKIRLYINHCFSGKCIQSHTKLLSKSFFKYFIRANENPSSPLKRLITLFVEKENYDTWSTHYKTVGTFMLRKKYVHALL